MSIQYNNIKIYLNKGEFEIITTEEEYISKKNKYGTSSEFQYNCNKNHINTIRIASFINKKNKIKDYTELCPICVKKKVTDEKLIVLQAKVLHNNHTILSYENNKNITYECGNCFSINKTTSVNLFRKTSTKFCNKCQNDKFKLKYENIKERVEKKGMKLLLEETEYENNKQLLPIICICGKEYKLKLFDIERGRHCIFCKNGKSEELCRTIFQELTGKKFINSRPKWLNGLELDGYNKELKMAWEYNGKQHYLYVPEYFHRNNIEEFHSQQERDKRKIMLCEKNEVNLLVIPYKFTFNDKTNLEIFIKKFLEKITI